jgi:hypothetical protein
MLSRVRCHTFKSSIVARNYFARSAAVRQGLPLLQVLPDSRDCEHAPALRGTEVWVSRSE